MNALDEIKNLILLLATDKYNFRNASVNFNFSSQINLGQNLHLDIVEACGFIMKTLLKTKLIDNPKKYDVQFEIYATDQTVDFIVYIGFEIKTNSVFIQISLEKLQKVRNLQDFIPKFKEITSDDLHKRMFKLFRKYCYFLKNNSYNINLLKHLNQIKQISNDKATIEHNFLLVYNNLVKDKKYLMELKYSPFIFLKLNDMLGLYNKLFYYLYEDYFDFDNESCFVKVVVDDIIEKAENNKLQRAYKYTIMCRNELPKTYSQLEVVFTSKNKVDLYDFITNLLTDNNELILDGINIFFGIPPVENGLSLQLTTEDARKAKDFSYIVDAIRFFVSKTHEFYDLLHIMPIVYLREGETFKEFVSFLEFAFNVFYPALKELSEKNCSS